jgi:hypothetical protein
VGLHWYWWEEFTEISKILRGEGSIPQKVLYLYRIIPEVFYFTLHGINILSFHDVLRDHFVFSRCFERSFCLFTMFWEIILSFHEVLRDHFIFSRCFERSFCLFTMFWEIILSFHDVLRDHFVFSRCFERSFCFSRCYERSFCLFTMFWEIILSFHDVLRDHFAFIFKVKHCQEAQKLIHLIWPIKLNSVTS